MEIREVAGDCVISDDSVCQCSCIALVIAALEMVQVIDGIEI